MGNVRMTVRILVNLLTYLLTYLYKVLCIGNIAYAGHFAISCATVILLEFLIVLYN